MCAVVQSIKQEEYEMFSVQSFFLGGILLLQTLKGGFMA